MDSASQALLFRQIADIQHMERGKLTVLRETKNGTSYKLQAWEDGRNFSRYVAPDQVEAVQEAIDGFNKFQELTQQYARDVIDQTRIELAAKSKKKIYNLRRNSSRSTTRNSGK